MKQIIKNIVPRPLIRTAVDMRDRARLAAIARHAADAAPLRPSAELVPDGFFRDADSEAAWHEDHGAIKKLFGDGNLLDGVNPGDRRALYMLIRGLKPARVLEVGTHIGASTLHIARALKNHGGRVTTVDIVDVNAPDAPWQKAGLPQPPRALAAALDCAGSITFAARDSLAFMEETAKNTTDRFDFIFLDGDHSAPTVYREVGAALSVLNPGGTILLHDYYPRARPLFPDGTVIHGPFRALARIARENPEIGVRPLGDLPWPTKQGTRATSLALLTRNNAARSS